MDKSDQGHFTVESPRIFVGHAQLPVGWADGWEMIESSPNGWLYIKTVPGGQLARFVGPDGSSTMTFVPVA